MIHCELCGLKTPKVFWAINWEVFIDKWVCGLCYDNLIEKGIVT